nr:MAG TPA: hypothetical protein [Caudoviricetes sp.]
MSLSSKLNILHHLLNIIELSTKEYIIISFSK